jgi:hypothetical protein
MTLLLLPLLHCDVQGLEAELVAEVADGISLKCQATAKFCTNQPNVVFC